MTVLLSVQGLGKTYAPRELFADLTFDLRAGEKVGMIGPNGAGKSTLLKILGGREVPDQGTRTVRRGARIGYLAQEDRFDPGQSVQQVVAAALADVFPEPHEQETQAAIALTRAGFPDLDQPADSLSGGWRKRLAVAREFARKPDFLLLDEPTNHLDLPGVLWLERVLRAAPFGYLVVTHDRAFLRAVADDILEVSRVYPGGVFRADGGYDAFEDKKEAFLEAQDKQRDAVANQVRRETDWLGRKAAARTRKASSRIEAALDRREELAELNARTASASTANLDFAGTGRQTKKLITATGVAKSLGGKQLFQGVDLLLAPGDRLGLLGANGSGKSTLLRILAGTITPDSGTVVRADGLRTVVFEQGGMSLDLSMPLRRALSPNGDQVVFRDRPIHVAAWAQRFLFRPAQLDLELSALSGGERARVRLAQLMLQPADVLMLDEPTNDLDMPALDVLETSLAEFPGAVVLVSHDRELMDRLCTGYFGLIGGGSSGVYGSVSQWLTAYEKAEAAAAPPPPPKSVSPPPPPSAPKAKKLSYKEQREWEGMEEAVMAAEEAVVARQAEVEAAATAGHQVLNAACAALEAAQKEVERLYSRWQELEAKRG